jgi:hypothetical protein
MQSLLGVHRRMQKRRTEESGPLVSQACGHQERREVLRLQTLHRRVSEWRVQACDANPNRCELLKYRGAAPGIAEQIEAHYCWARNFKGNERCENK